MFWGRQLALQCAVLDDTVAAQLYSTSTSTSWWRFQVQGTSSRADSSRPPRPRSVFKLDALLTDLWATVFSDTCGREFTRCVYLSITFDIVRHARVLARYEPHVEQVEWQKRGLPHAHILLIHDEPIHPIGLMSMET